MIVSLGIIEWVIFDVSMGEKEGKFIWRSRDQLVMFLRVTPFLSARPMATILWWLSLSDLFIVLTGEGDE